MTDKLREMLTNAGRVLALEGQGDHLAGHVSVRLPGGDGRFLMKPAGIGLEEMSADNIIIVDLGGERVAGTMPCHHEVYIHTEVFRARPEIASVVHTHPMHCVAFSALGRPLVPVGNDGAIFAGGVPVFAETTDLIITKARGEAVARALGQHHALILRNHGIVTAGRTIEEAVWYALKLDRACRMQLLTETAGGPKHLAGGADLQKKSARVNRGDVHSNVFNYLVRRWYAHCGKPADPPTQVFVADRPDL